MILLSLDQSSRTTGWAIFKDSKLLKYGIIEAKGNDLGTRLLKFKQELLKVINTYKPSEVVFEEIQLQDNIGNNIQTFKALACIYGIVEELLTELKIPHSSMASSTWKSVLHIEGKARAEQKKNAASYVKINYKVEDIQDISDAICIGTAYIQTTKSAWDI